MEQNAAIEHETTLEHALDVARSNAKEAKRLLDDAIVKRDAGEVNEERVTQLQNLLELANEDLKRVTREQ